MKKRTIFTAAAALLLLALLAWPVSALEVVAPMDGLVADYANVLSAESEQTLNQQVNDLDAACGAQFAIVTVDFLGGADIEDYAYALFNSWGLGDGEKDNGLLLLLAIGDENYWCMQGSGLEDSLSAGVIGDMLYAYLEPDFATGDYEAGVESFAQVMCEKIYSIYGLSGSTSQDTAVIPSTDGAASVPQETGDGYSLGSALSLIITVAIIMIIVVVVVMIFAMSRVFGGGRRRRRTRYTAPAPIPAWVLCSMAALCPVPARNGSTGMTMSIISPAAVPAAASAVLADLAVSAAAAPGAAAPDDAAAAVAASAAALAAAVAAALAVLGGAGREVAAQAAGSTLAAPILPPRKEAPLYGLCGSRAVRLRLS